MSAGGTLFFVGNYQEMHKKPLLGVFYQDYSNASLRYTAARKVHNWTCLAAPAKEFYHSNDDTAAAQSNGCWFIARWRRGHLISMYSGMVLITHHTFPNVSCEAAQMFVSQHSQMFFHWWIISERQSMRTATLHCAHVDELINDECVALVTGGVLFDGLFIPSHHRESFSFPRLTTWSLWWCDANY